MMVYACVSVVAAVVYLLSSTFAKDKESFNLGFFAAAFAFAFALILALARGIL